MKRLSGRCVKYLQAITDAEEDMQETSSLFLDKDVCDEESISAFSKATATIVAKVFTSAFVKVSVTFNLYLQGRALRHATITKPVKLFNVLVALVFTSMNYLKKVSN